MPAGSDPCKPCVGDVRPGQDQRPELRKAGERCETAVGYRRPLQIEDPELGERGTAPKPAVVKRCGGEPQLAEVLQARKVGEPLAPDLGFGEI